MRALSLLSLLALALIPLASHPSEAQVGPPLQMRGYADTTSDTGGVSPALPYLLRRARALVSMARSAPGAAPSIGATRKAAVAADDASDALRMAMADYNAGYYAEADTAAQRAIGLSEVALAAVLERHPGIIEAVSAGEVSAPPRVTTPALVVTMAATAQPLRLPTSYAEAYRLPFGVAPAGPGAPPLRDSLPFGVIPVNPAPAPVAPARVP